MVTDVFDAAAEIAIPRHALWALLLEPETYPRVYPGIGACEQVGVVEGNPLVLFRIGTPDTGIAILEVRVRAGRAGESLELQCPARGSFVTVRMVGDDARTRVTVTCFAVGRLHPRLAELPKSAVVRWIRTGLERAADIVRGKATSVAVNGEDSRVRRAVGVARQMLETGVVGPSRPDLVVRQLRGLARWGFNLAGAYAAGAARAPHRVAVVDGHGSRTYAEIDRRSDALAHAMGALGLRFGDALGLLARNHAGMVETMVAAGKLGVDTVLLNAGLSARRIEEIVQRDRLSALFVDGELESLVGYLHEGIPRVTTDGDRPTAGRLTIDDLIELGAKGFRKPPQPGRLVVLTSGTTGAPKGARRPNARGFGALAALLSRIPLRMNDTMLIPAPLFHTWGLSGLQLGAALRATVVLPARFDAEDTLRLVAEHRVTTLLVVPTMAQRLLDLPTAVRARYDTSSLRVVASCGAPLAGSTVLRFLDTFGDILYNIYGSTEVSWATIATPEDLRISPMTAGRPPLGTKIAVLGDDRRPVPVGVTGRIFVGNQMLFDGYVNAVPPEENDGLLDTGDLGYLDVSGRLFIAGREDEMIISGGENVFPRPVEEALAQLPQVNEVAVVGVPDPDFGQRLAAFVVRNAGAGLDSEMVRRYLRHRLGRVSVPRDVAFLDGLPRGETGKVLKRLLITPEEGDVAAASGEAIRLGE
ncbi:AMP-binding protein [Nocardia otitidiscaviarum]|uniref:AMP-binding protein n=1 Tax=Nocardia otitidiscaviarum TaxID=1823 RepID=A0A516NJI3_9NOCA|nr:AMP-binding protein [Nocardia otitidiscaviarum]MCP9619512.1 AMP-binding protein [Nocardia otitidiscaviarum]QDP79056.1 AMP-binding protein [Nocardia otitidiscaviarum]